MAEQPVGRSDVWAEDEFAVAVDAYLGMLSDHRSGRPFVRAEIRRALIAGPLSRRTEASVEFRMQNISAVMELQGRAFLPGYLPARQVGARGTRIIASLLDADDRSGPSFGQSEESEAAVDQVAPPSVRRRVFVTGMWGFDPGKDGYVGFTQKTTRDRLLAAHQPGDLMLVVGQASVHSAVNDVGRLIGLVELEPRPIEEAERMSADTYREKVEKFGPDRWRYALPVKRAWKMGREVKAAQLIAQSYNWKNAQFIGASFKELTSNEAQRVLELPVLAVPVWGEPEWEPEVENMNGEQRASFAATHGPRPTFGTSETTRVDGETRLYIMRLTGCVDHLFPKIKPALSGRAVVKVGISNDPKRRVTELNFGFPPAADARWTLIHSQKFSCADDAGVAERLLLDDLTAKQRSLGGEFAWVPEKELATLLAPYVTKSAFVIRA